MLSWLNHLDPSISREPWTKEEETIKKESTKSIAADFVRWDSFRIPLRSNCVDAIVSDMPFDSKCKMKKHMFVPIWKEFFRVIKTGGRAVLLIRFKKAFKSLIEKLDGVVSIVSNCDVSLGGVAVTLFVIVKN